MAAPMARFVLLGNSGSGKSTLASRLAREGGLAHLDLDVLAWEPEVPPRRRPLDASARTIATFAETSEAWVIEGCYADLAEVALPYCTRLVFLDPGVHACIANARARPWEPHKYASKEAQDANLEMLLGWIHDYDARADVCSRDAHVALVARFPGRKTVLRLQEEIASFSG
jgi:adenylate kinase family enzyme